MLRFIISFVALCILYVGFKLNIYQRNSPLRNLPGPESISWLTGNLGQVFSSKGLRFHHGLVEKFGGIVKIYGFFGDHQLYISDPLALQSIINLEHDAFDETSVFLDNNKIIFGEGLVATSGFQHKKQRKITTPVFSVTHLRELMPVFHEVAQKLCTVITQQSENEPENSQQGTIIDMAEWMSRVALETVGRTILGYSFDPLDSPHNNPYTSAIKGLIPTLFSISLLRQFAPFLCRIGSPGFRRAVVEWTPVLAIQKIKTMSDVMYDTAKEILHQKMEEGPMNGEQAKARDIISVLLKANNGEAEGEQLTEDELIGQMTVLIFGAQDTTSSALSRMLYMLATHSEAQTRLRQEIQAATVEHGLGEDGQLGYDEILALPWLDALLKETLRLYPPVPFVRRVATKTRVIPLSEPVNSPNPKVSPISSIAIPKGTTLFVAIAAANRLESVWGHDAKQWKPERWLTKEETGSVRLPSIYSGMMTFLSGERSCIGYKFAQIEMKVLLATLISHFAFSVTDSEVVWNLSQIISPSVRVPSAEMIQVEKQGLPLYVRPVRR